MARMVVVAQQIVEHVAEPRQCGDCEKVSRDLVVQQADELGPRRSEPGMITCHQFASFPEHVLVEMHARAYQACAFRNVATAGQLRRARVRTQPAPIRQVSAAPPCSDLWRLPR